MSDEEQPKTERDEKRKKKKRREKPEIRDLESLLDRILEQAEGDEVRIRDVTDAVGRRSYAPALVFAGLIGLTPIGAIPLVPAVCATLVILIVGQALLGWQKPWIPKAILDRRIPRERFEWTREKLKPFIARIDRFLQPRLTFMTTPPLNFGLYFLCTLYCASYYVLGLIPFATMIPAFGVLLAGLAILSHDGLLAILSMVAPFVIGAVVWGFFNGEALS